MKYYIIDEKKAIIDSNNNMLELRLLCHEMNQRLGGQCQVVSHDDYIKLPLHKIYKGKQIHELKTDIQSSIDLRFVCEGCSVIVSSECDLEYISDELAEYQYCSDCAITYQGGN